ncbi:hypothetical protein ABT104_09635 [Streptomyces mobaraensis]|uniref:hypothetical protein n=1 Tax=Streptomyces mobaraensis TaxID=35621 RepID=UPI00332F44DE
MHVWPAMSDDAAWVLSAHARAAAASFSSGAVAIISMATMTPMTASDALRASKAGTSLGPSVTPPKMTSQEHQ